MTEPGELDMMSMCERAGRVIGPCSCAYVAHADPDVCDMCVGTGVMPATLQVLYKLVTDIADMVEKEERDAIATVIRVEAIYKNGENN